MRLNLSELVKSRREALGYSQEELEGLTGILSQTISAFETGRVGIPGEPERRRRLAQALGLRHIDILAAAGVLDWEEIPGNGEPPPVSEVEMLLGKLSLKSRQAWMTSLRLHAHSEELARRLSAERGSDPGA